MIQHIINSIDEASKVIGKTYPLYTFVASNPLAGHENSTFQEAVSTAKKHFKANAFPSAKLYRQALEKGDINSEILISLLEENTLSESPEYYLELLEAQRSLESINDNHKVDRILSKWLSAFMDEGLAEWDMPFKTEGFYAAWRHLAIYDSELGTTSLRDIPKTSSEALEILLNDYSETDYVTLFTYHLAALPGWTGYINHRTDSYSEWQQDYPIDLMDYLAVRLWVSKKLNKALLPENQDTDSNQLVSQLQYLWLKAWEETWQSQLIKTLKAESITSKAKEELQIPDAQMVFCIDTRSELIRRHVEKAGHYETYGYAGFFGIAMDYTSLKDGITRKSCPPIVASAYKVSETALSDNNGSFSTFEKKRDIQKFANYFLKRMKNMLPSAFGFVEGSGFYYGLSLTGRTLISGLMYRKKQQKISPIESICHPEINGISGDNKIPNGISLEEKVRIVKSAFDLMGWKQFAPLVIFVGHGSHSANNPFSSSLDCGACAASPGRHNARMLAKLANEINVKQALAEIHGIEIPQDTVFIGAEHNTTTDAIVLFDSDVPSSHNEQLKTLKLNLLKVQQTATKNRLTKNNSVSAAHRKASKWDETRPEWGLAKNAGFIVGPRDLTKNINLDSRCFLHSYDWKLDAEGKALEGIMQGPMVVTQWINNHYYFSTVDNTIYGGGTKITHNITGKFGVVQGNGGDLKMGLPLQSLFKSDVDMYHQPLRLTVMIQAPICRVSEIVARHTNLKTLLDNEWIYLMVMDPEQGNTIFKYKRSIQWISVSNKKMSTTVRNHIVAKELV